MPKGDTFPNAEERRLFYVALTRARSDTKLDREVAIKVLPEEFVNDERLARFERK